MKRTHRGKPLLLVAIFAVATAALLGMAFRFAGQSVFAAAPPSTMNFQGRLADASGTIMPNGLYNMRFSIYTASSGGTAAWTETRETTNRVQVTNGLFSTRLGEVSPLPASLFNNTDLYFEITMPTPATATCSTASCQTWESPMTSRQKLATSAYAFNSDTLDGLDSSAFAAATGEPGIYRMRLHFRQRILRSAGQDESIRFCKHPASSVIPVALCW